MEEEFELDEKKLEGVSGGVCIANASTESNLYQSKKEDYDRLWDRIKTRQEWHFKEKEQELAIKKMWIENGCKLFQSIIDAGAKVASASAGGGGKSK